MTKLAAICVAFAAVLGVGAVQGVWSDRWNFGSEPEASASRLEGIPKHVGEWDGTDGQLNAQELAIGEIVGYVHRRYTNRRTGEAVTVLLSCGRSGPLSVHTPDVCYGGQGYEFPQAPVRQTFNIVPDAP